jgi:hypothetical protein
MSDVQGICRNAGSTNPNPATYTPNSDKIVQLNDLNLLLQMLTVAYKATGTPTADHTITYYGTKLTQAEFPQAYEMYTEKVHGKVPEYSATKKVQVTTAGLADRLTPAVKKALEFPPKVPKMPKKTADQGKWINSILGNQIAINWVNGLTAAKLDQALAAATKDNDKKIIENLKKLVSMLDVARTATGKPTEPSEETMTGLGCSLSGAPVPCNDPQADTTKGTYGSYIKIHEAAPLYTATSKTKKTLGQLLEQIPESYRTQFGITADWINNAKAGTPNIADQLAAKISLVKKEIVTLCGSLPIKITTFFPGSVKQGETLQVKAFGINLPSNALIYFALGANVDGLLKVAAKPVTNPEGTEIVFQVTADANAQVGGRTLVIADAANIGSRKGFSGFSVASKAGALPGNCKDKRDNDRDGKKDLRDEDCQPGTLKPNGESTPLVLDSKQALADLLYNKLQATLRAGAGVSGSIDAPLPLKPAAEARNLYAEAGIRTTVYGQENALIKAEQKSYEFQLALKAGFYQSVNKDTDDTRLGNFGAELNNRFHALDRDNLTFDLYAGYSFNTNNYANQNRWFFDGTDHQVMAGIAANSDFGGKLFLGRVFAEYRNDWFHMNEGVLRTGPFSGTGNQLRTGGSLTTRFSNMWESEWNPDLTFGGYAIVAGRVATPSNISGGEVVSAYDQLRGWGASALLDFVDAPVRFSVGANYARLDRQYWDPMQTVSGSVGVDLDEYDLGKYGVTAGYTDNLTFFYKGKSLFVEGKVTGDKDWFDGADSVSVRVRGDSLNGQTYPSAFLEVDLLKAFVPTKNAPPPELPPAQSTSEQPKPVEQPKPAAAPVQAAVTVKVAAEKKAEPKPAAPATTAPAPAPTPAAVDPKSRNGVNGNNAAKNE